MAEASYDRQHLAIHAAGFISADGSTATTFGCQMTRVSAGQYAMVLDANNGLINDESFIQATVKGGSGMAGVDETSNTVKTINVIEGAASVDRDIEVILFKSVTH